MRTAGVRSAEASATPSRAAPSPSAWVTASARVRPWGGQASTFGWPTAPVTITAPRGEAAASMPMEGAWNMPSAA